MLNTKLKYVNTFSTNITQIAVLRVDVNVSNDSPCISFLLPFPLQLPRSVLPRLVVFRSLRIFPLLGAYI